MTRMTKSANLRYLIQTCIATSLAIPLAAHSQAPSGAEPEIEEVVITGSYIRNSAFGQNSPVDTVSQTDLLESGAPSMSAYIRDLSYTQNTNLVNNVLGSASGSQNSISTSFNLRGLGENSTLTLIDGTRSLNPAMNASLPEIALDRMELVLDGGSALYGSDAVAGVVNLIAIQRFDGIRARTYYQRTEDGAMEDMNASLLWGRSFDRGIDYVGAFETRKKTPLMSYERPREMSMSSQTSISGNPGAFREVTDISDELNLYGPHGGTHVGGNLVDPSCETFNEGSPLHGRGPFPQPSGTLFADSFCTFEYGIQHPFSRHQEDFNLYNSVTVDANDWLSLRATVNNHYRINNNHSTSTSPNGGNDRDVSLIRADHPNNPFGVDVTPWNWRPFAQAYTHRPSHFHADGSQKTQTQYSLNRVKVSADYDIAGSWSGYSYFSNQSTKNMYDLDNIDTGRLQLALDGQGGPNGDEYFNPFGSSDPRSPHFVAGVTENSRELTEWLWYSNHNFVNARDELQIFESVVTGDVYQLPTGAIQTAFGYQWRDLAQNRPAEPHAVAQPGIGYEFTSVDSPPPKDERYVSEVNSFFGEVQVPILATLDAQIAVRHEDFKDFGLDATTPKISLRWEAHPSLALRTSWGESFLAPSPVQSRPFIPDENCRDMWSGRDEISGELLIGGLVCSSGNPNLRPESSDIWNVGFTWEPGLALEGLVVSMDYQQIEYVDRIRSLTEQDTVAFQFRQFQRATGITAEEYDPTPGSATRNAADTWLAQTQSGPGNPIERAEDGSVTKVFRQAANISSVWIDLLDLSTRYTLDTQGWGSFTTTLQATYYTNYEYEGLAGGRVEALGKQNSDTGIVPPLPEFKGNLRLNWFRDNHSASVSGNYWHDVDFDGQIVDLYPRFRDEPLSAPDTLRGEYIVDARYGVVIDQYFSSEFTLSGGINNVFDKRPQRAGILNGFESRLSTPWGRQFWMSLEWRPGI